MLAEISGFISVLISGATITAVNTIPFSFIQSLVLWGLSTALLILGLRVLLFGSNNKSGIHKPK